MMIDLDTRLEKVKEILPRELQQADVLRLLQRALAEDLSADASMESLAADLVEGDITSWATIPAYSVLNGQIRSKAEGIVAGLPIAQGVFRLIDPKIDFQKYVDDGAMVGKGTPLAAVSGQGRGLLTGERSALNFLGRMSGIASLTHEYVEAVKGTKAVILDTRKTAPGLRRLDKYAVKVGGGQNHRMGLFDYVLIKDNHISGAGGITPAVKRVRRLYGDRYPIEVEVKRLEELEEALGLRVDRIMLDNMSPEIMRIAVEIDGGRIPLEASGNVSLSNVREIAETGVDYISSGSLTHSAPTLDISMKIG